MNPNVKVGQVTGTGAAITVQLGFVPDYVEIINYGAANPVSIKWFKGMTAAHGIKLTGGASPGHTKITSNGISPFGGTRGGDSAGFIIGADAGANVNGNTIVYIASRSGAGGA